MTNQTATTQPTLTELVRANVEAAVAAEAMFDSITQPDFEFAAWQAAESVVQDTAFAVGAVAHTGCRVQDADGPLYVASIKWHTDGEKAVTLTADGMPALDSWHTGKEAEAVRVECWTYSTSGELIGRYHGWVDSYTRRTTQTG